MSSLRLFLLGSPRIERDGVPITLDRHKSTALLAYLTMTRQSRSRDELATLLWPDFDQTSARASLRRVVAALKKGIGPEWLKADRDLIGVDPDADIRVDVEDVTYHIDECKTHGHSPVEICQACLAPLSAAVALYRGDFMEGFSLRDSANFEEWQLLQSESLRRTVSAALSQLVYGHSIQREFDLAIAHARRWLALDPLNEAAHRDLMRLYTWSGQHATALSQYRACKEILERELGLAPQEETAQLYEAIRANRLDPPAVTYLTLPLVSPAAHPHNLPLQLTPFIGREEELAELARLLEDPACRLVSLIGPGGIGKTRLAIQAASQHVHAFRHGACYAALAPVSAPEYLVSALADALKFSFHGSRDPTAQLVDFLREKQLLLVMDNFEQLMAATPLMVDILQNAPQVKTIVTSRERLNVQGEWTLEVGGLKFPAGARFDGGARYSAVQLFVDSARRRTATFAVSEEDRPHIIRICQLVEGVPLAIELAATWVRVLSLSEIAHEIERDLDFLSASQRDVPKRHRSLRVVFEYSWNLLEEPERAAVMALSMFRGGFRREAAEQVGAAPAGLLLSLVDKSFLRHSTLGRYDVHDLLRQYALRKLEENPARETVIRDRCAQYYAEFMHRRQKFLRGGRQKDVLDEIAEEIENVRATWQWAVDRAEWDVISRCAESLFFFYDLRSLFHEGAEAFGLAAERLDNVPGLSERATERLVFARLLARQARFLQRSGRFDRARALFRRSLEIAAILGARQEKAFPLTYLGDLHRMTGDYEEARRLLQESVEICTESGDGYLLSRALNILGIVASLQGEYVVAERLYRHSLAIQKDIGDRIGMSLVLNNLGGIALLRGEYARARQFILESLAIQTDINDLRGAAASLDNIGGVMQALGEWVDAKRILQESLAIKRDIGDQHGIAHSLNQLGETASALDQHQEAGAYFLQALKVAMEVKAMPLALDVLGGIARLRNRQGESTHALELLEFVLNHAAAEQETRDRAQPLRAQIASEFGPQVVAAAQAWGRGRMLEEIVEEVWAQVGSQRTNTPILRNSHGHMAH